ncbi:MAG: prolyl oligopeptidase family serine peptidase [candidate division Zixibacteria bacterium]|nr:prolyl oligopeptidase family serine peptidase [candidate division Zixibacteria bacterium]
MNAWRAILLGLAGLCLVVSISCSGEKQEAAVPPTAEKKPHVDTLHGDIRVDDYYWLRDKEDSNVIAYLEAENEYLEKVMAHTEDFQEDMYEEILSRIKETDINVPYRLGDYYYYSRTEEGKDYPIYCRKKGSLEAEEEIYLDQNVLAKSYDYMDIGLMKISPSQQLLAYTIDTTGFENFTLFVKDLESGDLHPDIIKNCGYSVEWANDNQTLFYTIRDSANRPFKLFRHKLATEQENDALVYHETDDMYWMGVGKTKDDEYLIMATGTRGTDEYYFLDADNPTGKFKIVHPRTRGLEYSIDHYKGTWYIVTNDNATNFKLMKAPVENPGKDNWSEVIPHREDVKLDYIDLFEDHMVVWERADGLRQVQIRNFGTGEKHYVEFPEPVYSVSPGSTPEFKSKKVRLDYVSLVTPQSVFDYDMNTKEMELKKQREVLGGYDKTQYASERVFATGNDGAKIPISIMYRKDNFKKDGTNPMYFYVYGAYGNSLDPWFSSSRLSLLNRGFAFCIAHVRGGGEMGREWYDSGKKMQKINTFEDVISSSEYLIEENYTSAEKLVLVGGSAGGTTVGAAMNMRPDLFEVVIAHVPFVDIINTLLDPSIPLTTIEWEELGNPQEEEYYKYMLKYSPYDNVEAKEYPAMLVTTGLNDPRVAFWEPAKWVAKMRQMKTDDNPLLLKTNMGAGHMGASGRYDYLKDLAFEYVFILDHFGIDS